MSVRALIVGAAETRYARRADGETTLSLLATAVRGALRNADLTPNDVDGLAVASFTLAPDHAADLAWRLGLRLRWLMEDTNGGASGLNMLQHARRAVETGDASAVVVVAGDALSPAAFRGLVDAYNSATRDHLAGIPFGGPNSVFALLTRRHMRAHGLGRETYGLLVLAQREWATLNPRAVYRAPLTLEEYLAAPLVSDPLGRYDCVPVVSGADAVVVAAADNGARRKPAVSVRTLATSVNPDQQEGDGLRTGLADLADRLWAESGFGPEDVDLAGVYDDYPAMVLVQLADLGFVPDGDVERFVATRIATRALPVNTSGGQLSAGQAGAAGGLHGLVEAVRQLRGDAGERQVEAAEVALVTGYGMVAYRYGACANAAVLRKVQ
jgi:acetyl-CoA acetyltransferase